MIWEVVTFLEVPPTPESLTSDYSPFTQSKKKTITIATLLDVATPLGLPPDIPLFPSKNLSIYLLKLVRGYKGQRIRAHTTYHAPLARGMF
jgi:hypothetical protein